MFFLSVMFFMNSYMSTTLVFQIERPVFLREQANHMYGVTPYYCSKILSEIPVYIVIPIVATPIVYFGIGFTVSLVQYCKFMLSASAEIQCAIALGYFISCAFSVGATAGMISPIVAMPIVLVGGFYSNSGTMPAWLSAI